MRRRVRRIISPTPVRFGAALLAGAALFLAPLVSAQSKPAAPAKKSTSSAKPTTTTTKKKKPVRRATRYRGQAAPNPERVGEIQEALIRTGHLSGKPTKKWDAGTVSALKAFQAANDLSVTGKLSAKTLQKLGLGSEVAGVAPPRPAVASAEEPQRP